MISEPVCPDKSMASGPCVGDGQCPAGSQCLVSGNNPNVHLCCESMLINISNIIKDF